MTVNTSGTRVYGIFVQSAAGSGGSGGSGYATTGGGGAGGSPSQGGAVTLNSNATVNTTGDDAIGILGQSVGGSLGAAVTADVTGQVATAGRDSAGILAQSLGGGGGNGGMSIAGAVGLSMDVAGAVSVGVGGYGGGGGNAGAVSLTRTGLTLTNLGGSDGVSAQSIGGGGGNGGLNVSGTLAVSVKSNAGAVSLGLGGFGGDGGNADAVNLTLAGNVLTGQGAVMSSRGTGLPGFALGTDIGGSALVAQSIGGGGGRGGLNVSAGLALTNPETGDSGTAAIGIGGFGGGGGNAGAVVASSSGTGGATGLLVANGDGNAGFLAQSIGGSGGNGGINISGGVAMDGNLTLGLGGFGGAGGTASSVKATSRSDIFAAGVGSAGIAAQSLGGGGGMGGINVSGGITLTKQASLPTLALGIGGFGGAGNIAGNVAVDHVGRVGVEGGSTVGILAQSVGGGGGMGGINISAAGTASQQKTGLAIAAGVGGNGGTGANARSVQVSSAGLISVNMNTPAALLNPPEDLPDAVDSVLATLGLKTLEGPQNATAGILAQSIGGGGGVGGLNGSLAVAPFGSTANVGVGGSGGAAGDASTVSVVRGYVSDGLGGETASPALIVTKGDNASGLVAQSIGGGGDANVGLMLGTSASGLGGNVFNGLLGAVGGGTGAAGGPVTVNQTGTIVVYGDNAQAVTASSINGGGGSLTFDLSGITDLPGTPLDPATELRSTVAAVLGGTDSNDTSSAPVTVNAVGSQVVTGAGGSGSGVQSIGGGGGTAYLNLQFVPTTQTQSVSTLRQTGVRTLALPAQQPLLSDVVVTLGQTGGVNNNGAPVSLTLSGDVLTDGADSPGQILQSIGGGGGRAVVALDVTTASPGAVRATLGAVDTLDASGGAITASQTGAIDTVGAISPGVMLQSIGGGGGSVGARLTGGGPLGAIADLALGADGGSGLDGGAIAGTYSGGISTQGAFSTGLMAQSVGAGGGDVRLVDLGAGAIALGGLNGATGTGGAVDIANVGQITTVGDHSHGVMLQSIGGGGGAVFGTDLNGLTLRNAGIGNGGTITFVQTGDIVTQGNYANGIIAQSIGGDGGWVEGLFAGTAGGQGFGNTIDLSLQGSVLAAGQGSTAVFAQSAGQAGSDITIGVTGNVRGGSGIGAGIWLDGGDTNVIQTSGSLSAVSQLAVLGTTGNETIDNTGLLYGNIRLGSGENRLFNRVTGTFMAASEIQLRTVPTAVGLFQNEGLLLMGLDAPQRPIDLAAGATFADFDALGDPRTNLLYGARVITQTDLSGDFVQTATGRMVFDVAYGPYASDHVRARSDVTVNGKADITLTWLENSNPVVLFEAIGGAAVDQGLQVTDTLALDYSVLATLLGIEVAFAQHFDQPFLTPNGRALGKHMNSAITLGNSGGIGRLMAWLGNLKAGQEDLYGAIISQISPEGYLGGLKVHYQGADRFRTQMMQAGTAGTGASNVWSALDIEGFSQKSMSDQYAAKATNFTMSLGWSADVGSNLRVITGIGYRRIDSFRVTDGPVMHGAGDALHLGAALNWQPEQGVEITGSVTGGWQWLETTRQTDIFGPLSASARPESRYAQFSVGGRYTYRMGTTGFLQPAFDLAGTALHQSRFSEQGMGGIGMQGDSRTQWLWSVNPRLKGGFSLQNKGDTRAEVHLTVGGVFQLENTLSMPYRFVGANPAADPALLALGLNANALQLGADVVISHRDRATFSVGVTSLTGKRNDSLIGNARFTLRF